MENATKALLISAGILFAIVIVSIGIISYNGIKNYYGQKQTSLTAEQLAAFNREFEAYNRDDVTGFELVSLINKIINFNSNNAVDEELGFNNTDKDFQKMYIEFELTNDTLRNGIENYKGKKIKLFENAKNYKYDSEDSKTNRKLTEIISYMQSKENTYTGSVLSKLVSNREYLKVYGGDGSKTIRMVLGNANPNDDPQNEKLKCPGYDKRIWSRTNQTR